MLRQKIFLFVILFFTAFFTTAGCSQEAVIKLKEYGIDNLDQVKMSYRSEGGHSSFTYIQVEVQGDGNTTCVFEPCCGKQEQRATQIHLDKSIIKDFIRQHAKLDFFEFDFGSITESFVYDAPEKTLSFQFKDRKRAINYAAIKTKAKGRLAIPINKPAEELLQLQKMYWRIINQEIYLDRFGNYQKLSRGDLAEDFSFFGALVHNGETLDAKKFVPIIMEIISQKELRDSIGQYAADVLEKITGEKPPGDWWDCEKWLKWWDKNKNIYEKK